MDIYLFNTVINSIWYVFTILFLLYKFTTFFSHAYNFLKFCGKLISSGKYVVNLCINYFQQKQPISPVEVIDDTIYDDNQDDIHDENEDTQTKSPSFLNTIKTTISNSIIMYTIEFLENIIPTHKIIIQRYHYIIIVQNYKI
jgi:hypothetical protein